MYLELCPDHLHSKVNTACPLSRISRNRWMPVSHAAFRPSAQTRAYRQFGLQTRTSGCHLTLSGKQVPVTRGTGQGEARTDKRTQRADVGSAPGVRATRRRSGRQLLPRLRRHLGRKALRTSVTIHAGLGTWVLH